MSNINADPLALEFLCRVNARSASTERVQNDIAFVGTGTDDSLKQALRLLCWIRPMWREADLSVAKRVWYSVVLPAGP